MNKEKKYSIKKNLVNAFGVLGYLFCTLEWVWILILYFGTFQDLILYVKPQEVKPIEAAPFNIDPVFDPLILIISIVFVVSMIALTVYILVKTPSTVARTGKKLVHEAADATAPMLIRAMHRKETKKFRLKMSSRLVVVFKTVLMFLPLVFIYAYQFAKDQPLDYLIVKIIGFGIVGCVLILYLFQYVLARFLKIKMSDIW